MLKDISNMFPTLVEGGARMIKIEICSQSNYKYPL